MKMEQPSVSPAKKERLSAVLCYCVIPFHFVPALVIWLIWKGQSEFVCRHARTALNIYLTSVLLFIALAFLWPTPSPMPAVYLAVVLLGILAAAAYRAWRGFRFDYPLFLPLVR